MLVIPVIDVMQRVVVHGRFGRRDEYRPIESSLCPGADPVEHARMFQSTFGVSDLYVADLDAIAGQRPWSELYDALGELGLRLWIDPGVCTLDHAEQVLAGHADRRLVVGLESLPSLDFIKQLLSRFAPDRLVFSLDLMAGRVLTKIDDWRQRTPMWILDQVVNAGIKDILLLDLSRVGSGEGTGTESLAKELRRVHPIVRCFLGGGVRGLNDLARLASMGTAGVLVASALHDGRLTPDDVRAAGILGVSRL